MCPACVGRCPALDADHLQFAESWEGIIGQVQVLDLFCTANTGLPDEPPYENASYATHSTLNTGSGTMSSQT